MSIRQGPLVPAQSLYPLRVTQPQSSHLQNQNVQNQLQQRSESIYGIRSSMRQPQQVPNDGRMPQQITAHPQPGDVQGFQPIYGTRNNPNCSADGLKFDREARENSRDDSMMSAKFAARGARPESMYGVSGQRRVQSAQSDDSSYGSYHGSGPAITPPTRNASNSSSNYNGGLMLPNYGPTGGPGMVAMNAQMNQQQQQERKASSSSSNQQQQSNRNQQQQQQQQASIQGTNLPPPPPGMQNHPGGYQMHPVRQN